MDSNYELTFANEANETEADGFGSASSEDPPTTPPKHIRYLDIQMIRNSLIVRHTIDHTRHRKCFLLKDNQTDKTRRWIQSTLKYIRNLLEEKPIVDCLRFRIDENHQNLSWKESEFYKKVLVPRFIVSLEWTLRELGQGIKQEVKVQKAILQFSKHTLPILDNLKPELLECVIFTNPEPFAPEELQSINNAIDKLQLRVVDRRSWYSDRVTGAVDFGNFVNQPTFEMYLKYVNEQKMEELLEKITQSQEFEYGFVKLPPDWSIDRIYTFFESLLWKIDYSNGDLRMHMDMNEIYYLYIEVQDYSVYMERRLEDDRMY